MIILGRIPADVGEFPPIHSQVGLNVLAGERHVVFVQESVPLPVDLPAPELSTLSAGLCFLTEGDYYVRVGRLDNGVITELSAVAGPIHAGGLEWQLTVDASVYAAGDWRVFFGTTAGALDRYADFLDLPGGFLVIGTDGNAGVVPTRIDQRICVLNLATGQVLSTIVRGKKLSGTGRWSWCMANNRLHGTNGTDQKFLMKGNGVWTVRDIGLRAPTAEEAAAVAVTVGASGSGKVPKSTVGGAQPGYQFYIAFWNRITGAVSNRVKVGPRILFTDADHEVSFATLPDLSQEDSEIDIVIGRSSDGAEVPYAIVDASENWVYVPNGQTTATVTTPSIDGAAELPTKNTPPPVHTKAFARVGDYLHAITSDGPWCYRSEIGVDDPIDSGHVGRPEQNWGFNPETFPTGDKPIAVHGYSGDAYYHTLEDLAIMVDQEGVPGWQGPWHGAGIAGQDAFAVGFKGYPYWVSGHKQLWTMTTEGPLGISDEYEAALLSKIGDAYLSEVQLVPYRDVELQVELLCIKARDNDGNPFIVIHDFNARDERSPYGQGLELIYGNQLAQDFYLANLRDKNGRARLWAGGNDGRFYQLFDGVTDNGNEFEAELISLLYIGPQRTAVKYIEWYGDAGCALVHFR